MVGGSSVSWQACDKNSPESSSEWPYNMIIGLSMSQKYEIKFYEMAIIIMAISSVAWNFITFVKLQLNMHG